MKHMWRIKMGFGNTTYTYKSLTGMVTDGHGEDAYAHLQLTCGLKIRTSLYCLWRGAFVH